MSDPDKSDYVKGRNAGCDAGIFEEILHDAIPFRFSEGFEKGFDDGLAERDEE